MTQKPTDKEIKDESLHCMTLALSILEKSETGIIRVQPEVWGVVLALMSATLDWVSGETTSSPSEVFSKMLESLGAKPPVGAPSILPRSDNGSKVLN